MGKGWCWGISSDMYVNLKNVKSNQKVIKWNMLHHFKVIEVVTLLVTFLTM